MEAAANEYQSSSSNTKYDSSDLGWLVFSSATSTSSRKNAAAGHQRAASTSVTDVIWLDKFYESSSGSHHRRAVSDTLATFTDEAAVAADTKTGESSGLHMHQAMTTFDDLCPFPYASNTILSPPSDSNSGNEAGGHKTEAQPVSPAAILAAEDDDQAQQTMSPSSENFPSSDPNLDPKRARRIIANRQSAQRSRIRKLQYIAELEKSVNSLQIEVSTLSPQVSFLDHQRVLLNVDNNVMRQRIATIVQNLRLKDVHNEALRKEVERLRKLYQQQQQQFRQMSESNSISSSFIGCMKSGIMFNEAPSMDYQPAAHLDELEGRMVEAGGPLSLSLDF